MLAALGDDDGRYMQIFSIFLGTALLTLPVLSYAESQLGPTGQMQLVSVLAILHALFALAPSLPVQIGKAAVAALYPPFTRPLPALYLPSAPSALQLALAPFPPLPSCHRPERRANECGLRSSR